MSPSSQSSEVRRQNIVREIVDTERAYKDSLEFGVNYYMKALMERTNVPADKLLEPWEITEIFQNLEMIYKFSCEFLNALEISMGVASGRPDVRLSVEIGLGCSEPSPLGGDDDDEDSVRDSVATARSSASTSASGGSTTVLVGEVFSTYTPFFKLYIEYMAHYDKSIRSLMHAKSANPQLSHFLDGVASLTRVEEKYRGGAKDIQSILIRPIQRIPRYRLLLEELKKHTAEDHTDYPSVEAAVVAIANIADHLNREMKDRADREKVYDVQNSFVNGVMFIDPRRRFVRDGELVKICRKGSRKYYFVLFSDLLVYAHQVPNPLSPQKKYYLHRSMRVQVLRVEPLDFDDEKEHMFFLKSAEKSFKVVCPDEETKNAWVRDISMCVDACTRNKDLRDTMISSRNSVVGGSTSPSSAADRYSMDAEWEIDEKLLRSGSIIEAKVMQSHEKTFDCQVCREKFGFWRQKYNCDNCGKVVCSSCAKRKRRFPKPDENIELPVRICDICFESLQTNPYKRDVIEALKRRSNHGSCWMLGDLPCFNMCFEANTTKDGRYQSLM